MADEKISTLRIDGSQAETAIQRVAKEGERLLAVVERLESATVAQVSSFRDYNAVARMVGDSIQSVTRFEAAYAAALKDTANSARVKATALAAMAGKSIQGNLDEARAAQLSAAGHEKAADAVRYIVANLGPMNSVMAGNVIGLNNTSKASRACAYQYQNLAYQLNDVVSGFAMGQKPMQILAQQGGQIAQIFWSMNSPLKALGGQLGVFAAAIVPIALAGAAYLSYRDSIGEVNKALRTANGTMDITASRMESQAQATGAAGNISVREARSIQAALISAGTLSGANFTQFSSILSRAAQLMGDDAVTAAEKLGTAMEDPAKAAVDLNGKYWTLTAAQLRHIDALTQSGEKEAAQSLLIQAMSDRIGNAAQKTGLWTRAINVLSNAWDNFGKGVAGPTTTMEKLARAQENLNLLQRAASERRGDIKQSSMMRDQLSAAKAEVDRLQVALVQEQNDAALRAADAANQGRITAGTSLADKLIPGLDAKKQLENQARALEISRDAARAAGDTEGYAKLSTAYDAVAKAAKDYITEGQRAVLLAQAKAKADGMTSAEGAKYLATETARINALGKVATGSESAAQQTAALTEANAAYNKAMTEQGKALSLADVDSRLKVQTESLNQEREILAQRRALGQISAADELAGAVAIGDKTRAAEEQAAQQRLAILRRTAGVERAEIEAAERAVTELRAKNVSERQKQMDEEVAARERQAKQLSLIAAQGTATSGGTAADTRAESLRHGQAMGDVTSIQDIANAERAIADERYRIELDLLNKKLELANQEPAERAQILSDIKALEEKHSLDLQKIDNQTTENRLAAVRTWSEPFKSAVNTMVSSYISGTQTLRQISLNAANYIASSYIGKFADIAIDWFGKHVIMAAWDKLFATQAVATKTTEEAAKTTASEAGVASRSSIATAEQASFLTRAGSTVAGWFGLETAKTAATTAEEGVRTGVTAAGAATREGVEGAETAASIELSAARGAAGAYADAATNIPWGWLIGAGIAAAVFAAVMAFSSRRGEKSVAKDGALYQLHAKETVLPASYAVPLANALESGVFRTGVPNTVQTAASLNLAALPRFGLPPDIMSGPKFGSPSTTVSTANRGGDIQINLGGIAVGKGVTKAELEEHGGFIAKLIAKEVRNGNRDALYVKGKGRRG